MLAADMAQVPPDARPVLYETETTTVSADFGSSGRDLCVVMCAWMPVCVCLCVCVGGGKGVLGGGGFASVFRVFLCARTCVSRLCWPCSIMCIFVLGVSYLSLDLERALLIEGKTLASE